MGRGESWMQVLYRDGAAEIQEGPTSMEVEQQIPAENEEEEN